MPKEYNETHIPEEDIEKTIKVLDIVREEAVKNKNYAFGDDWILFMKKMRLLTPQSSGAKYQNRIFESLGWTIVDQKLGKGDVKNSLNQFFEVKASVITTSNPLVNMVQIRPWQEISGHYIFVIDSFKDYKVTTFYLSKAEMKEEIEKCGGHSHGTKKINEKNTHNEYSIRFNWIKKDDICKRWEKYEQKDMDVAKLNSKED